MTDITTMPSSDVVTYKGEEAIKARMIELFENVPQVDSDSLAFVAQVLNEADVTDLIGEMQTKLPKAEEVAGRKLKVYDLARNDSDIEDTPYPYYLVVHSTDTETGDTVLWQTSAGEPLAKLLRIYEANKLPALVETRKADKATRKGFYPVNMIVYSMGG